MEVPLWLATILIGSLLGAASYLIKLVFSLNERVTRIEEKIRRNGGKL